MQQIILLSLLVSFLFVINKCLLNYWTRQGIPQGKPKFLFGDFKTAFLHKESIADVVKNIYLSRKHHKIFGVYLSYRPILFINDPNLIRDIILKDSAFFPDRGLHVNGNFDPLSEQLFFQGGSKWRKLRSRLTPAFTSGKLKAMLPIVTKNGKILIDFITKRIEEGTHQFEFRDLVARLNTNVITSVAFGIEVDTISDPKHIMRQIGVKVFEPNLLAGLRFFTSFFMPIFNQIFKFKFVNDEIESFFKTIIEDNVHFRETSNYQRSDLMQTLIQLKNDGFLDHEKIGKDGDFEKITLSDVCGQSFGFYLGGFETTSTTVSYCLHELAKNLDKQHKAQKEVDEHFKIIDDGAEMYAIIQSMKYLQCCMFETLRKYPPLPLLNRKCVKDYKIADSSFIIKKGTPVIIPNFGLHRDPEIYKEPLEFRPERFLDNPNGSDVDGLYFLPFGGGQRICIGHRMGKQNTTFQLALLLSKFHFELTDPAAKKEITFNPNQLFLQPIGNINLKVSLRNVPSS